MNITIHDFADILMEAKINVNMVVAVQVQNDNGREVVRALLDNSTSLVFVFPQSTFLEEEVNSETEHTINAN